MHQLSVNEGGIRHVAPLSSISGEMETEIDQGIRTRYEGSALSDLISVHDTESP